MFRCRSSSKTFCETFWYDDPGRAPSSSRRFTKCHKTFEDFLVSIIDPTILPIWWRTACHLLCDITTSDTVRTRMQLHSRSAALVCPNPEASVTAGSFAWMLLDWESFIRNASTTWFEGSSRSVSYRATSTCPRQIFANGYRRAPRRLCRNVRITKRIQLVELD